MAILQGTPVNTSGIHPFVAIMANGQASIDQSIARAGQGMAQANATSAQYIRDGIQGVIDQQKLKLQKDAQAAQVRMQEAQLSLQERQMAERSRQFDATLAARAGDDAYKKQYQDRQLKMQDLKLRLEERKAAMTERALSSVFGSGALGDDASQLSFTNPGAMTGSLLPSIDEPSFDLTSVVSDQDVEGMPINDPAEYGIDGTPPSLVAQLGGSPTGAPLTEFEVAKSAYDASVKKEILGLKIAAMSNPSNAGYAIQKIAELEGKQAQAAMVAAQGGPSGQVADIVNERVLPFAGLVKGTPTPASIQEAWANASPATKAALQAPDAEWDSLLKNGSLQTEEGAIPVDKEQLYNVRETLNAELMARDKGAAEARFVATQQFKESGDQYVTEMVKANPYWNRIEKRRAQLDDIINADMKRVEQLPSRDALVTLSSAANSIRSDRSYLTQQEETIKSLWKELGKKVPGNHSVKTDVDGWHITKLREPKDKKLAPQASNFNKLLDEYIKEKRSLSLKERNLSDSLNIMDRKGFEVDVNNIREGVFNSPLDVSGSGEGGGRRWEDKRETRGPEDSIAPGKRLVPDVMSEYLNR